MDANQTSDLVLSFIKRSNLNFNIVESPFSLSITIKKTFIKNKDGTIRESGLTDMADTSLDQSFPSQQPFFQSQQSSIYSLNPIHNKKEKVFPKPPHQDILTLNPPIQHFSNPQILPTQTLVSRQSHANLQYPANHNSRLPYPQQENFNAIMQQSSKSNIKQLSTPTCHQTNMITMHQTGNTPKQQTINTSMQPTSNSPMQQANMTPLHQTSNTPMLQTNKTNPEQISKTTMQQMSKTPIAKNRITPGLQSPLPAKDPFSTFQSSLKLPMMSSARSSSPSFSPSKSPIPPSEAPAWELFSFKFYPDIPSDDDDDSYTYESVHEFKNRILTNLKKN